MWYHKYGGILRHHRVRWQCRNASPGLVSLTEYQFKAPASIDLNVTRRLSNSKSTAMILMAVLAFF